MTDDFSSGGSGVSEDTLAKLMAAKKNVADGPKAGIWCLYGDPGSGRTSTAALLGENNLILTCEKGFTSLNSLPEKYQDVAARTEWIPVRQPSGISTVVKANNARQLDKFYDNIVIDTATGIYERQVNASLKNPKHKDYKRPVADQPSWPDYGYAYNVMRPTILDLFTSEADVTIICHVRYPNDDQIAQGQKTRPDLGDAVFRLLNEETGVIGFCTRNSSKANTDSEFIIRTQPTARIMAKGWTGMKPEMTQSEFIEHIRKYRGK